MLENVQVRATKLVDGMKSMKYAERLQRLDLPTLLHRRERGDMIQVWKHFTTYDQSTLSSNFRQLPRTNRKHPFQLTWNKPKDGTHGVQSNSFYFRVAKAWNMLPNAATNVVVADNVNTFKARLDATWIDSPTKFTIENPSDTDDDERFGEAF